MSAKVYLNRVRILNIAINSKINQLKELNEMKTAVGSPTITDDPVQTSKSGEAPYTRIVERIAEIEQEIRDSISCYTDTKARIIEEISALSRPEYVDLLVRRYSNFERLEQIAYEMHYSYDHVRRLHGLALSAFEKLYPEKCRRAEQ